MKYVIFKRKGFFIPVILPECTTHACVTFEDAKPVGAGMYAFMDMNEMECEYDKGRLEKD